MSIFSRIKDAIFGAQATAKPTSPTPINKPASPTTPPSSTTTTASSPSTAPQASAPAQQVDVEAVLNSLSAKNPQKLNWRTSIVDLLKLLGIDSSLEHRRELAAELGYKGDTVDSAAMNIWLHKQVMTQLAANGGNEAVMRSASSSAHST